MGPCTRSCSGTLPIRRRRRGRSAEARRALVLRYLDNVVAADRKMVAKVFHVLRWTPTELNRTIAVLLGEGAIQEVQVKGVKQLQLVPTPDLGCTL